MRIDPLSIILSNNHILNKKFYFVSGNELTLIEKITKTLIEKYKKKDNVSIISIDTIEDFVDEKGLFENKKVFLGRNCKGINEKNFNKLKNTESIFIFIQENSQKIKKIKSIFAKDKESFLIDCYELDKNTKTRILNDFINKKKLNINKELFWFLVEKLDNKYMFLENSLYKIIGLENIDITLENIKKLLIIDDSAKERIFFNLFKKNQEIIKFYREKIITPSDVNGFYYYCKFFCLLIVESNSENEYKNKIPAYLFRDRNFLIEIYKKYNSKKRKLLLNLLSKTERVLRKENDLSLMFGLRFLLNIKKITIS